MAKRKKPSYVVGYKKTPASSRFKPGKSGNPKGRPKNSKNFATTLQKELETLVEVTENGRKKTITKREAVVKQLVNKAASGDPRATPLLLRAAAGDDPGSASAPAEDMPMPREYQLTMESIVRRIRLMDPPDEGAPPAETTPPDTPLPPAPSLPETA